jgi:hypothetical protein
VAGFGVFNLLPLLQNLCRTVLGAGEILLTLDNYNIPFEKRGLKPLGFRTPFGFC